MAKKPGIAKRTRPQRDSQGRFAAKSTFGLGQISDAALARQVGALNDRSITAPVFGVQLGENATQVGPNALKRFRNWLGFRLIALGGNILSL